LSHFAVIWPQNIFLSFDRKAYKVMEIIKITQAV